mmetsp:Transcript_22244/g.46854  ORF Transcript_22244/g.46854 Transcript_22244/m.46854 type:complete len:120 (-) Transcript_22244:385-744(-)
MVWVDIPFVVTARSGLLLAIDVALRTNGRATQALVPHRATTTKRRNGERNGGRNDTVGAVLRVILLVVKQPLDRRRTENRSRFDSIFFDSIRSASAHETTADTPARARHIRRRFFLRFV